MTVMAKKNIVEDVFKMMRQIQIIVYFSGTSGLSNTMMINTEICSVEEGKHIVIQILGHRQIFILRGSKVCAYLFNCFPRKCPILLTHSVT